MERHGVRVESAADAGAALRVLREELPDVVLCDVLMPGVDGYAFHEAVRADPAWRSLPFVYATALGGHGDYRRGMNRGADGYLSKPFTEKTLLREITLVLARHRELTARSFTVTLLGGQSVREGAALLSAPDRGAEGLVFYLLTHTDGAAARPVARETVLDEMWGGGSKSGFRSLLSRARRWSEPWAEWSAEGDTLRLSPKAGVRCDLYALEAALHAYNSGGDDGQGNEPGDEPDASRLTVLYPGPLLPGYSDLWAEERRQALHNRVKESLLRPVPRPGAALRAGLRRLLELDPHDFDLWERYIGALEAADLHAEAARARAQRDQASF